MNFREDIVRLDYAINEKDNIYGRWIQDYHQFINPFGTFCNSNILSTTPALRMRPGQSFLIAETWFPPPHTLSRSAG